MNPVKPAPDRRDASGADGRVVPPRDRRALLSGCSEEQGRAAPVDPSRAREALHTALESWKKGDTIDALKSGSPPIVAQDFDWMAGHAWSATRSRRRQGRRRQPPHPRHAHPADAAGQGGQEERLLRRRHQPGPHRLPRFQLAGKAMRPTCLDRGTSCLDAEVRPVLFGALSWRPPHGGPPHARHSAEPLSDEEAWSRLPKPEKGGGQPLPSWARGARRRTAAEHRRVPPARSRPADEEPGRSQAPRRDAVGRRPREPLRLRRGLRRGRRPPGRA